MPVIEDELVNDKVNELEEDAMVDKVKELIDLVGYLVVNMKEIYTLSQLRTFFNQIAGDSVRSIDIKKMIQEQLKDKVMFYKLTHSSRNTSEYVVAADSNVIPDTIHLVKTGEGITSCLQLRSIARSVSEEIQSYPKNDWPPTPQKLIETEEIVNNTLFNFIAWVVSPSSCISSDGYVNLSPNIWKYSISCA